MPSEPAYLLVRPFATNVKLIISSIVTDTVARIREHFGPLILTRLRLLCSHRSAVLLDGQCSAAFLHFVSRSFLVSNSPLPPLRGYPLRPAWTTSYLTSCASRPFVVMPHP